MSLPVWIAVGVLGGFGAIARSASTASSRAGSAPGFPLGILAVNLSGAFAAGLLLGAVVADEAYDMLVLGLLGGFTTFSTWMLQTHELGQRGLAGRRLPQHHPEPARRPPPRLGRPRARRGAVLDRLRRRTTISRPATG